MILYHALFSFSKHNSSQLITLSTFLTHTPENTLSIVFLPQLPRTAILGHLAITQHQDPIKVRNCAQSMRNYQQRRVGKLLTNRPLNQRVRCHIDSTRGLVEDHDAGPGNNGPREAEQLALALREVETTFGDGRGEVVEDVCVAGGCRVGAAAAAGHHGRDGAARAADEVHPLEAVAQFGIGMPLERVEVSPYGTGEEHWVLRDDGEAAA